MTARPGAFFENDGLFLFDQLELADPTPPIKRRGELNTGSKYPSVQARKPTVGVGYLSVEGG